MTRTSLLLGLTAALVFVVAIPFATVFGQSGDSDQQVSVEPITLSNAFTYQGRLTDDAELADGAYDLRFILFDAASGGAQVGTTVTLDNVAVVDGYFTATLDFGAAPFNGDARWLEVAIKPGNTPLTDTFTVLNPRQALTAVPYALHAMSAGSGDLGLPASESVASAAPTAGLAIAQTGSGDGVVLTRAPATPAAGDTLDVTNTGAGAALRVTGNDVSGGIVAVVNGTDTVAGSFTGDVALAIDGAIRVTGDMPVFVHEATSDNLCESAAATAISHPFTDDAPSAVLLVTFRGAPGSSLEQPATAFGVAYDDGSLDCVGEDQWVIYSLDSSVPITDDMQFNVMVVNR